MKRLSILAIIFLTLGIPFHASAVEEPLLAPMRGTAYCVSGVTASGAITRPGICASNNEMLGKTAIIYQRNPDNTLGEFVGIFEVLDSGGSKGIKNGNVIDIWEPDLEQCQELMDLLYSNNCEGKIFVQFIDAEG